VPGSEPSPKLRGRIELVIRVLAPALDVMLAVGDRVSRVLSRSDPDYVPARMPYEGESAPRGLRPNGPRTERPPTPRTERPPSTRG
jgi:hypothetical protein